LKFLSFKKKKKLNLQGINTLSKIHIYPKFINKKMSYTWTIINIYYNNLPKKLFKNSFTYERVVFGQKVMKSFLKVKSLARLISFAPPLP